MCTLDSTRASAVCSYPLAACFLCQERYRQGVEVIHQEYDRFLGEVNGRLLALRQGNSRREQRDALWRGRRRVVQQDMRRLLNWRQEKLHDWEDVLAEAARALSQDFRDLEDLVLVWSESCELAMQASTQRQQEREERAAAAATASSQVRSNAYAMGASDKYADWFSAAHGREKHLGPVGACADVQPALSHGWRTMTNVAWAQEWLERGGYRSAEQTDEHGATALHHALQATVFWDLAHRVCRGLIDMMSPDWLRAKTWGGRFRGYAALHLCANGSDVGNQRADLVSLLVEKQADPDATDDQGRTPFLHAAGTGVVDVAAALSQAGCDIYARSFDGRNAGDRCQGSSGQMRQWASQECGLPHPNPKL